MPSSRYQHTFFQLCDFWTHCMGTSAPSVFLALSKIFRRLLTQESFTTQITSLVARGCVGHVSNMSHTLGTKLCNALWQNNFCFSRKGKIFFKIPIRSQKRDGNRTFHLSHGKHIKLQTVEKDLLMKDIQQSL